MHVPGQSRHERFAHPETTLAIKIMQVTMVRDFILPPKFSSAPPRGQFSAAINTLCIFFGGSLLTAFRSLSASIKTGDDRLHERVNRVRDEYVRRVDLDDLVAQLRDSVRELRDETREASRGTNTRLDQVLAVLAKNTK